MALLDEQPYIGYPQMGRRRAMPNRDVEMNQGLLRGASYYPYDLLGSPIDLINMGLKPLGMGSQKPVMGSDYLQSLAQQYGLSQQPTGSNAENVARLAMSAMNPATGARAVGRAIEPTMQALAPKAYGLLEDYMVKSGGMIPLTAYHGTPHNIQGKFDISKMGTGEGAQVYGPGMYFAEAKPVAQEYASRLAEKPKDVISGYINYSAKYGRPLGEGSTSSGYLQSQGYSTEYAPLLDKIIAGANVDKQGNVNFSSSAVKTLSNLDSAIKTEGNVYKVDIPDKDIPNMLNWDTPLSQQPTVLQSIKNLSERQDLPKGFDQAINRALGDKFFDGQDLYYELTKVYKDPLMLRQAMQESGFTGIRYLDQCSRTPGFSSLTPNQLQTRIDSLQTSIDSGSGNTERLKEKLASLQNEMNSYKNLTSNFVVFEPSTVNILEKNDKLIEGLLD
jgi:hypothetical protein